jgi:hypothetical protein
MALQQNTPRAGCALFGLKDKLTKLSFPHAFSGVVAHGYAVNGAKDANPVKQISNLLYIIVVYDTSLGIVPIWLPADH